MDDLKSSKQAVGASTLVAVNDIAPPAVLAQASRLAFSTRLFNLLVTNIPGPQVPLYILGHELQDLFPLAFLPAGHALAVAIMSYNGRVEYGLLGDFDALPDIDVIAEGIDFTLSELVTRGAAVTATESEPLQGARTEPLLPTSRRRTTGGPAADMRAKRAKGCTARNGQAARQLSVRTREKFSRIRRVLCERDAYTKHTDGASPNPSSSLHRLVSDGLLSAPPARTVRR